MKLNSFGFSSSSLPCAGICSSVREFVIDVSQTAPHPPSPSCRKKLPRPEGRDLLTATPLQPVRSGTTHLLGFKILMSFRHQAASIVLPIYFSSPPPAPGFFAISETKRDQRFQVNFFQGICQAKQASYILSNGCFHPLSFRSVWW